MRILYIDIDTLRPDHLSCYGYHRATSPHIDAIADEGLRFENYYVPDAPCLPSRTALFTGRFGFCTGVVNHGGNFADMALEGEGRSFRSVAAEETLASAIRRAGWHTASISPFANRHSAYQVVPGFTETYDTGKGGMENADETWPVVEDWLARRGKDDQWFLHVNLWDPHTPYDTPEDFGNPFEKDPIAAWLTQAVIDKQQGRYGPNSVHEVNNYSDQMADRQTMGTGTIATVADAKKHIDGYDTGIHYADLYVGKIVARLKDLGVYDDTAIIVSSDHGENHGELGIWGDHQSADHVCSRVPFIMKWPGVTDQVAGQAYPGLHYNLDFTATLAELAGAKKQESWQGESFAPALKGETGGRPYLVVSQGAWSCQRAVRWDHWILIRTWHTGFKPFPPWMLFDLEKDPHETTNLAASLPDIVAKGRALLEEWTAQRLKDAPRGDPFEGVLAEGGPFHANENSEVFTNYLQRLRDTGRAHHAETLETIKGNPLPSDPE